MQRRLVFLVFACLFLFCHVGFADNDDDKVLLTKSQLLVQKGKKAEQRGEIEEAVASYEEAYNVYPKNILPLLLWGKALSRIGMYARADELLDKIPLEKLPDAGKSEVFLFKGKIALAMGSLENCAAALSKSVKASKNNISARIRLAMVNQILGLSNRADELLREYDSFEGLPLNELVIAFFTDLQLGNLGRAFSTCGEFSKFMTPSNYPDEQTPFLTLLWKIQPVAFLTFLPLALGGFLGPLYFLILFGALLFLAHRLSEPTAVWHDIVFVLLASVLMIGAQKLCQRDLFIMALSDQFSINDSVWVIPRLLISGNLIAIGLFAIFPAFKFLPDEQRPRRFEYYGIWFFCWFFMIFVLVFQSRISFGIGLVVMVVSALLAFVTTFFMPLGRFILYKIFNLLGFGGFAEVSRKDINSGASVSFTDAKILESKAWKLLEKDDWQEVVLTARKVQANLDKKTFPTLWKALIIALIAREDYIEAGKAITEFVNNFKENSLKESGELLQAYLKTCVGDFAGALKIIRSFSEDSVSGFKPDETALSLLVLGRCDLFYKENVQAHIDLNKAFTIARLPILKAEALVELIELDFNMNSRDSIAKWKIRVNEIHGGPKCDSIKKMILSVAAMAEGNGETAMQLAQEACDTRFRNGKACAWYGHLLCMSGRNNEAENLLEKMTPESVEASRLMTEVTGSGA
ncbi:MAG: hypothetical protein PWR01_3735 [Clostridiales bacterium]|nr:hypothetical protein [Clostridiales bacterium]MDN5282662.1 hypothetical protein [Candidatus Ozemobacter sp.]